MRGPLELAVTLLIVGALVAVRGDGDSTAGDGDSIALPLVNVTPQATDDDVTPVVLDAPPAIPGEETTAQSGLEYDDIEQTTGESPRTGQTVVVHYTGWLESDGTKFASSLDSGHPFEFTIGMGQVIKGFDRGVATMKLGEKRRLIIPPELAYGEEGAGTVIPPNATLIFDVTLLEIR